MSFHDFLVQWSTAEKWLEEEVKARGLAMARDKAGS